MATLFTTTYYLKKGLSFASDYPGCNLPETLDRPEHFLYGAWDVIAKDFNPYNPKDWQKIAKALGKFTYDFLFQSVFVNPDHPKYPHPRHPIHQESIRVYHLMEQGRTLDIKPIQKAYKTYLDRKWDELQNNRDTSLPVRYFLRRPRTTAIERRDLTEEERKEIWDTYRINIPRQKAPVTAYDDIPICFGKSWKDTRKDKKQYQKRKKTKTCPRF